MSLLFSKPVTFEESSQVLAVCLVIDEVAPDHHALIGRFDQILGILGTTVLTAIWRVVLGAARVLAGRFGQPPLFTPHLQRVHLE